jgi:hypothetical protein
MQDENILVVCIVLIFFAVLIYGIVKSNDGSTSSYNTIDDYSGGYDGGHNNHDNLTNDDDDKKNDIKDESLNSQTLNNNIMHNLRNLTISSTNPCLLVYLIDQSGSMNDKFGNAAHSKSLEVANAINDIIYEVGLKCIGGGGELKNRFEIAIIGYGKQENIAQSGWEGQLAGKWVVSIKNIFDFPLGQENDKPIWIKPYSVSNTPMTKAFENAKRLCNDWINWGNHRDCHPPIIINITDGEATDSGNNFSNLKSQVEQIKNLRTNYGNVKVMNIHITSRAGDKILFPSDMNTNDKFERLLFEMSTSLDENMVRIAQSKGYDISPNAKGYVFNGNASDLINFLNIGTPQ